MTAVKHTQKLIGTEHIYVTVYVNFEDRNIWPENEFNEHRKIIYVKSTKVLTIKKMYVSAVQSFV